MFIAEACLLQSVRDTLATDLASLSIKDRDVSVEMDGVTPEISGPVFIAVSPGGVQPGPRHQSSGGVVDVLIGVKITVYKRISEVPKDRRRSVYLQLLSGIAPLLELIANSILMNYQILTDAQTIIADEIANYTPPQEPPTQISLNENGTFQEPFRQFNAELSGRIITQDFNPASFGGQPHTDATVALARSITFTGARYLRTRAAWEPA